MACACEGWFRTPSGPAWLAAGAWGPRAPACHEAYHQGHFRTRYASCSAVIAGESASEVG